MSTYKNRHGLRTRVVGNGVIEVWLGEPMDAESCLLANFHEVYLPSVLHQLMNTHKAPRVLNRDEVKYG